ncbi:MAG: hypothetical protein MUO40_02270, partial [Anaerolineaceae bacterium]|nr:hypothetical protein [Anaerolineaceae bacterium]
YNPWPGTFFGFMDRNLKIHKAHVHEIVCVEPYRHYIIDGKPAIGTSESLFVIDKVQPAGKTSMTGEAFLNGLKNW